MKKTIIILSLWSGIAIAQNGNVGINTENPKATLHIDAKFPLNPENSAGILIPIIQNFPLSQPTLNQNGMLVFFDANSNAGNGLEGFYFWDALSFQWKYIFQTNTTTRNLFRAAIVANTGFSTITSSNSNTNIWYKTNFNTIDTPDPTFSINANGDIVIGKAGTYSIIFTGGVTRLSPGMGAIQAETGIFIGSDITPSLSAKSPIPQSDNASRSVNFTISGIVSLAAGDILSVKTRRTTISDTDVLPASNYSIMLSNLN